ncbi:glycosyltransferase [Corynebacterium sp. LK2510]|uniref:glycosyltransferase n=1 Tax=Corynebacterium sp. LK2510 TaxID=3110472 RepID=UPI0034CDC020
MTLSNPKATSRRVREFLRQSYAGEVLRRYGLEKLLIDHPTGQKSQIQQLVDEGKLYELLGAKSPYTFRPRTWSDRAALRRAEERISALTQHIPPAVNPGSTSPAEPAVRVLFFLTNSLPYTQSGYTFRSHSLLSALNDRGLVASAITRYGYPLVVGKMPGTRYESFSGVTYIRQIEWQYPRSLEQRRNASIKMLIEAAVASNAQVLHTTTDYNNALVVSAAARALGIPWIYEVRGELENTWLSRHAPEDQEKLKESDFYRLARAQETAAMLGADAVITLSRVSQRNLEARGVSAEKITVVPNAVEDHFVGMETDPNLLRRELGLFRPAAQGGPSIVVGTVSSIVGYEGLDLLIKAAASLPHIGVLLVGEGDHKPVLEKMVKNLGIGDRVIFTGRKPNERIWEWYGCLDAFVVPRHNTEVCRTVTPIKPLMAMALGIPVIASDLPALREITGNVARYFEPENVEALEAVLREVTPRRKPNSEAVSWAEMHTWQSNADRLVAMYSRLVSQHSREQ